MLRFKWRPGLVRGGKAVVIEEGAPFTGQVKVDMTVLPSNGGFVPGVHIDGLFVSFTSGEVYAEREEAEMVAMMKAAEGLQTLAAVAEQMALAIQEEYG